MPPILPDFYICDQRYGQDLDPVDCDHAGRGLQLGATAAPYTVGTSGAALSLPMSIRHGKYGVWLSNRLGNQ